MKPILRGILLFSLLALFGCQKEISFELGLSPGEGTLQNDVTGDCLPKTITGTFVAATTLVPTASSITVSVNVTRTGSYSITTDTVNGFYFKGTGTFTTLGPTNITLQGNGTPFAQGVTNFVVSLGVSVCDIQVTVLPPGTGPAIFTLAGAPGSCTTPSISGSYIAGSALGSGNTVVLNVNVTAAGSYNVSTTTVNGIIFSGTGTVATGAQTITLTGSGTPTAAGTNSFPVTVGGSTCNFEIITIGGAAYTLDCTSANVVGTYTAGVALGGTHSIAVPVTVTTAGPYSITASANGMTFVASGNLTLSTTSITLFGSGTPLTAGATSITLNFGASSCSVTVTVGAGASVDWKFNQGATVYQGSTDNASLNSVLGFTTFSYGGSGSSGIISFSLVDAAGGIGNETYNTASSTGNSGGFIFAPDTGDIWQSSPSTPGSTIVFTITSHNTTTKTITGNFSGTAKDGSGGSVPITAGTFTATYP